jgi:hypothetical protein
MAEHNLKKCYPNSEMEGSSERFTVEYVRVYHAELCISELEIDKVKE